MNRYELHTEGKQIPGSLSDLRAFVRNIHAPYKIFQIIESKANGKELVYTPHALHRKLSDEDVKNATRLLEKGYKVKIVAKQLQVGVHVIHEIQKSNTYQENVRNRAKL